MRLLFCEDEPLVRKLIELSLRGTGHEVRMAADGREGLEVARQWRPDVVLTDVAMPVMDGIELVAALRADPDLAELPVVYMTASVDPLDTGGPVAAGRLRKPFGPAALRELLDSLVQPDPRA